MKEITYHCDVENGEHSENIKKGIKVPVMFDHDQNDGKLKMTPYFEMHELDLCDNCWDKITLKRNLLYAYGAMGNNTYKF